MADRNRAGSPSHPAPAARRPTHGLSAAGVAAIGWVGLALAFVVLIGWPFYPSWLLAGTPVTFALFAFDKARAKSGGWRVPEQALLLFVLAGGVIGGWLGMRVLRHKTRHHQFWAVLWLATALHAAILVWLLIK